MFGILRTLPRFVTRRLDPLVHAAVPLNGLPGQAGNDDH
jgi:hypothetical protein